MRIEGHRFVAGVVLSNGRVIDAAPIIRFMMGWTDIKVLEYCRKKGWKVT